MTFQWPLMLLTLLIVPVIAALYVWSQKRRRKYVLRYSSVSLVQQAVGKGPGIRRHIPAVLYLGALTVMLVALARPVREIPVLQSTGTIMLTIDVSGSMQAEDVEPNRLEAGFREKLFRHTGGHPLFTIELLRNMQERGEIVPDEAGRWVEATVLDWESLPERVEGVIEERIGRLEWELRQVLTVGSIEGEDFTAEVVARVQAADVAGLVRRLSGELERQHRLVMARGLRRLRELAGPWDEPGDLPGPPKRTQLTTKVEVVGGRP